MSLKEIDLFTIRNDLLLGNEEHGTSHKTPCRGLFTMRNDRISYSSAKKRPFRGMLLEDHRRRIMFLVEEKRSQNGLRRAEIYMRPDGLFEGRIYRNESPTENRQTAPNRCEFEICGITETLPRVKTIVDEELDL